MRKLALQDLSDDLVYEAAADRPARARGGQDPQIVPVGHPFVAGRTVELDPSSQTLRVRTPSGQIEVTIRVTENGPVLLFEGTAAVEINQRGTLRLDVDRFEVRAAESLELHSGGALVQTAAGAHTVDAQGRSRMSGGEVDIAARTGKLVLDAAADLHIDGDRVLINC